MKPDPDMMRSALLHASHALEAVAQFQSAAGFSFGADATHQSAYQAIRDLADSLQSIGAKLHHVNLDADERLSPVSRMLNAKRRRF